MRSRITIQRSTPTQNTIGEPVDSWSDLHTCFARKTPMSGGERFGSGMNLAEHGTLFTFRYAAVISDLSTLDQIVHDGQTYDLVSVFNVEDRNEWFEVVGVIRG